MALAQLHSHPGDPRLSGVLDAIAVRGIPRLASSNLSLSLGPGQEQKLASGSKLCPWLGWGGGQAQTVS